MKGNYDLLISDDSIHYNVRDHITQLWIIRKIRRQSRSSIGHQNVIISTQIEMCLNWITTFPMRSWMFIANQMSMCTIHSTIWELNFFFHATWIYYFDINKASLRCTWLYVTQFTTNNPWLLSSFRTFNIIFHYINVA